jgi:hypothetical protein
VTRPRLPTHVRETACRRANLCRGQARVLLHRIMTSGPGPEVVEVEVDQL